MNTRRVTTDNFNYKDFKYDPFFIGFDRMVDRLKEQTPGQTSQTNYPPYNIVKTEENLYELQLAIAGFKDDELNIEVKDGILKVEGKKQDEGEKNYIHKGISARSFRRTFTLSDTIVVKGADLTDGILTVELENVIPEEKKPRKIEIGRGDKQLLNG